jgi:Rrf2 family transcriptional regulator, iron-sulfur cluster assembly transcription factor
MNFSKTASYSLNILSYMAMQEGRRMSANYLNEKLSIPYPYLRQVLKSLSRNGFINSTKGRSGGFTFSKEIGEIFLADIIEATDGLERMNKCILGFRECPFNKECPMHSKWETTRRNILKILKETSLADVLLENG